MLMKDKIFDDGCLLYKSGKYLMLCQNYQFRSATMMEELYYGDHEEQLIDIYPAPDTIAEHDDKWLVLIHGGYWRQKYDRSLNDKLIEMLTREGYNVANVEYRRGEHAWPIPEEDTKKALQAFKSSRYVDNQEIILIGHSVGGQLVLNNADEADRVIAMAPVTDVPYTKEQGLGRNAVEEYFGDITEAALEAASPMSRLPLKTKTLIIQGFNDSGVKVESTLAYVSQNEENTIDLYAFAHLGHMQCLEPKGRHIDLMLEWIDHKDEEN